jgi:DNA polymerase elongation subunit (family B)
MNGKIFAFDECSILNQCRINIPKSYRKIIGKDFLETRNSSKINLMVSKLDSSKIPKYKFIPSNFETNIVKVARQLIENEKIDVSWLPKTFESEVIGQLEEFSFDIEKNYQNINKSEDITSIKQFFTSNEKELKKERNLPEDDDLMILSGYKQFETDLKKNLISADEHFWGYDDLIENEFNIFVVKEGECHQHINDL